MLAKQFIQFLIYLFVVFQTHFPFPCPCTLCPQHTPVELFTNRRMSTDLTYDLETKRRWNLGKSHEQEGQIRNQGRLIHVWHECSAAR